LWPADPRQAQAIGNIAVNAAGFAARLQLRKFSGTKQKISIASRVRRAGAPNLSREEREVCR
jgi:hypothetical protein